MSSDAQIAPGLCLDWSRYGMPELWCMLQFEDDIGGAEQVAAWDRTYDLLTAHRANLQRLRDALAERWPPAHSPASRTFVGYLDDLIASTESTSYAAAGNANVLSDILSTMSSAKTELATLHDRWQQASTSGDHATATHLNQQAAQLMAQTDTDVYGHAERFVAPQRYQPPANIQSRSFLSQSPYKQDTIGASASGVPLAPDASKSLFLNL